MEDERLAQIEKAKLEAINQSNNLYDQMHQDNQTLLDQQTNYANEYERTQNEALDKQLEVYNKRIEEQKKQAQANYETESRKAENDYIAYNNPYGYQAETMASKGQLGSGISQTAQLGSYNAYQNRLSTANKTMQDAFTQYDLDMNEAIVNNDVQKAQNALAKLEMILGYTQNFYDTKNTINQNQLSNNQNLNSEYYGRYMDMINQINSEKEREEAIRQFEAQMAYKKEQDALAMDYQRERDAVEDARWEKEYNLAKKETNYKVSGGSGGGSEPVLGDDAPVEGVKKVPTTGKVHPDAKNGTFSNNYQPDNVGGSKLSTVKGMDGKTIQVVVNGKTQNLWQSKAGKYYYWDGKKGDYVEVSGARVVKMMEESAPNSMFR